MSHREKLSLLLGRSGVLRAFELLPASPGVIVFNYHRIGESEKSQYDRDLFTSEAQFDYHLSYIKRNFPVLLPRELADVILQKRRLTRLHAMITFDDGYLDNYATAFPLLKKHDLRATFFLVSTFVGTTSVPWWDEMTYLVRNTPRETMSVPSQLGVTVDLRDPDDRNHAVEIMAQAYKSKENRDSQGFLEQLRAEAQVTLPAGGRRFLNWAEAREMAAAGMELGAHTHTHPLLGKLTAAEQKIELVQSKAILEQNMGELVTSLAYPNGRPQDFNEDTQRIAQEAGYTTAYSYYGGINPDSGGERFNILRIPPNVRSGGFRLDTVLMTRFGKVEPLLKKSYRRLKYGKGASVEI
jgi:peptidoglycan/xylan/chitin deacetylase (PgdA/CDA1 family)